MSALAAAVSRRSRWTYEADTDDAHLSTGTSPTEAENPTGPWAMVSYAGGGPYGGYSWWAHPGGAGGPGLDEGYGYLAPESALDAAERAVDAAVSR